MSAGAGFVHLRARTDRSVLMGLDSPDRLAAAAAELGQPALAVTDRAGLPAAAAHVAACQTAGIMPVVGMELLLTVGSRHQPGRFTVVNPASVPDGDGRGRAARARHVEPVALLAMSPAGWANLLAIVAGQASATTERPWPAGDWDLLAEHAGGLIVMSGGIAGPVTGRILNGDHAGAERFVDRAVELVGRDRFVIEIGDTHPAEIAVRDRLLALADARGVRAVATVDVRHVGDTDVDRRALDVLVSKAQGRTVNDPARWNPVPGPHHLCSETEARARFGDVLVDGTVDVAAMCTDAVIPTVPAGSLDRMPRFQCPAGWTEIAWLRREVERAVTARYGPVPSDAVTDRVRFELDVIEGKGLAGFMLIVADAVTWARAHRVPVGPGRGSSAGSLVAHLLGVTELDPLTHGLMFERFLNPDRPSLPDIDVDVSAVRRSEVVAHLIEAHGAERVAHVATFGRLKLKAAADATVRAFGLNASVATDIKAGSELGGRSADARTVAERLSAGDGAAASNGVHPAGVVITPCPVAELVPVRSHDLAGAQITVTEWPKEEIEAERLVKLDVLAVAALDLIETAGALIDAGHGAGWRDAFSHVLEPASAGPEQARMWGLLAAGDAVGVFQWETAAAQRLLREVRPRTLDQLAAATALNRPGPLGTGAHHTFAARLHGREPVDYGQLTTIPAEQAAVAAVLDPTFGVLVFQESVIELAVRLAGFTVAEADLVRAAVAKKDSVKMARIAAEWPARVVAAGFTAELAERVWEWIVEFADYGFAKGHAFAYSVTVLRAAWLKANFAAEFTAAALTHLERGKRPAVLVDAARRGVTVVCPDVNVAELTPTVVDGRVVLGLAGIRDLPRQAAERVVAARAEAGPFVSFTDLAERAELDVAALDRLVLAGACDQFGTRLGLCRVAGAPQLAPDNVEFQPDRRALLEAEALGAFITDPCAGREHALAETADRLAGLDHRWVLADIDGTTAGGRVVTCGALTWAVDETASGVRILRGALHTSTAAVPVVAFGTIIDTITGQPATVLWAVRATVQADAGADSVELRLERVAPVDATATVITLPERTTPTPAAAPAGVAAEPVRFRPAQWGDRRITRRVLELGGRQLVDEITAVCDQPGDHTEHTWLDGLIILEAA